MDRYKGCKTGQTKQSGMTLLELIVVVAILGSLALVFFPTYQQQVLKSHRTQAKTDLMMLQLEFDKRGTDKKRAIELVKQGYCLATLPCQSDPERFNFSVTFKDDSYTINALAINQQRKDRCTVLSVTSNGKTEPLNCWQ